MTPIMIRNEFPSLQDRTPAWRAHRLAIHLQRQSWVQLFFALGNLAAQSLGVLNYTSLERALSS